MENRTDDFKPDEQARVEYTKNAKIRGRLLKFGFCLFTAVMACGTLAIMFYTFVGRGLIG